MKCFKCRKTLSADNSYDDKSRPSGLQRECRDCCRKRKAEWHKTESGKRSAANTKLKRRFGITIDDYEKMYQEQGGSCLICGAHESCNSHRLAVDHCHETGKVRGLLCKSCNVGIGNLKDNYDLCLRAARYLLEFEKNKEKK